jgi:hypothetical protein
MSGGSSISPDGHSNNALTSDNDPRGDNCGDNASAPATTASAVANSRAFSPIAQQRRASTVSQDPQQQQRQPQPKQQISQDEEEEDEEEDLWIVSCRCESAKAVSTLLSCLKHVNDNYTTSSGGGGGNHHDNFTGKDGRKKSSTTTTTTHAINPVSVFCSPTSITFHVYGKAKQTQASVDMQASSLFSDYRTIEPPRDNNDEMGGQDDGAANEDNNWKAGGEVRTLK